MSLNSPSIFSSAPVKETGDCSNAQNADNPKALSFKSERPLYFSVAYHMKESTLLLLELFIKSAPI